MGGEGVSCFNPFRSGPLQTEVRHCSPPPAEAVLTRKQKGKLCTQPYALPPRAAAAWVGHRARALNPPAVAPSPPPRPAAEKRDATQRCLAHRDFPGAGPEDDRTPTSSFHSRAQMVGSSPQGTNQIRGKERLTLGFPGPRTAPGRSVPVPRHA